MTTADPDRLAELDRIYDRLMEAATDQLMPGGKLSRQEAGYRNGRGRRRSTSTLREDVRAEAEAMMLRLAESSSDPHAARFLEIAREREELIQLRTLMAEAVFDETARKRMEAIVEKSKNGSGPLPDLVGTSEVAEMAGVTPSLVGQWQRGLHGEPVAFPRPEQRLKSGPIWLRSSVEFWLRKRQERQAAEEVRRRRMRERKQVKGKGKA